MFGLAGLQQRDARPFAASRPARDLAHQLKGAFGGAQVRPLKPEVRIDHADQRQQRKVVALRHKLRADDDVGAAAGNLGDLLLQGPGRSEKIRRQDRHPRIGEAFGHFLGQPFDPRSDRGKPPRSTAGRAGFGHRFRFAALMADKAFEEPVFDHARIAVIAADLVAAGAADRDGRVAAPVEEQERLFPALDPRADGGDKGRADPAVGFQLFGAHVDGAHFRQFRRPEARCQVDPRILARLGVHPGFQAGRRRSQHHLCVAQRCAQDRHVARVVKSAILLLVGGVVFLIHHDQPKIAERQEKRRPRADDKADAALARHPPQPPPFGLRHPGMPFARTRAKAILHPRKELCRQRDFGQEDQRLPPLPQTFGHRLEVDLGLAGPGHPLQKRGAIAGGCHGGAQPLGRRGLILGKRLAGQARVKTRIGQVARRVLLGHGPV